MHCLEGNKGNLGENYGKKIKIKSSFPMHCLFRSSVGEVKMTSFMSYRTNIMRIMKRTTVYVKLIDSMSIDKGNIEYNIAQK